MNFRFQVSGFRLKFYFLLFTFYFLLLTGCGSMPNLEPPECGAARQNVKDLYSYHFDSNFKPSAENLKRHEKYLSKDLFNKIAAANDTAFDYFTQTEDYPRAFRVGGCGVVSPEKTAFEVSLIWKDDNRSEERKIKVESVKENGNWLINKVEK